MHRFSSLHYFRKCPHCKTVPLKPTHYNGIEIDYCTKCGGIWFDKHELSHVITDYDKSFPRQGEIVKTLGEKVRDTNLICPTCNVTMPEYVYDEDVHLDIEVCESCHGIWLEREQFKDIREVHKVSQFKKNLDTKLTLPQYLRMFFLQLPTEFNIEPHKKPLIVKSIMALCVVLFLMQLLIGMQNSVDIFGLKPNELGTLKGSMDLFSHMFMHGGFFHIIGNLYLLYIFGDNIEDALGHKFFSLFYLCAGVAAALSFAFFTRIDGDIPMVGASGAIAGVMGSYLVLFRKARIAFLIFVFPVKIPAPVWLLGWAAINLYGLTQVDSNVAFTAHLGGFLFGIAFTLFRYQAIMEGAPVLKLLNYKMRGNA